MKFKVINIIQYIFPVLCISLLISSVNAQMTINGEVKYGHEWIDTDSDYYKFTISSDGLYKIEYSDLINAGIDPNIMIGSDLSIINLGEQVPFYVSTQDKLDAGDFILIEGEKNRSFLDQFLFVEGRDGLLNEYYSMTSDEAAYYLTFGSQDGDNLDFIENEITGLQSQKNYHLRTDTILYHHKFIKPYFKLSNLSTYNSHYETGEGFSSGITKTFNFNINLSKPYLQADQDVKIRLKVLSDYKDFDESQNLKISFNGTELMTESFGSFTMKKYNFTVNDDNVENTSTNKLRLEGVNDNFDRYSVPYVLITYPRELKAYKGLYLNDSITEDRYYEIADFKSNDAAWVFTEDGVSQTIVENGTHRLELSDQVNGKFTIYDVSAIRNVRLTKADNFIQESELAEKNLLFITSDNNIQNIPTLNDYKAYRESAEGGEYNASIISVERIYETFGYGVQRHQMGIKNLIALAVAKYGLEHVYFIGKGIQYPYIRTEEDRQKDGRDEFELPAFGFPSSDYLFASPVDEFDCKVSIGRLAYNEEEEVKQYFDKVREQEHRAYSQDVSEQLWRNRILHVNGGGAGEHRAISYAFDRITSVLDLLPYNPFIYNYIKTSQEPIQFESLEGIIDQVNKGVLLFNFFGHAGTTGFNIDINRPNEYHNEHLPLLVGLGCSAGNYNIVGETIGEIFCGYEKGGFIGVFATSHYATISDLTALGEELYLNIFSEGEELELGKQLTLTVNKVSDRFYRRAAEQVMFMGDPCYKLKVPKGPDVAVSSESVDISPFNISTDTDSITLEFDVLNLGQVPNDSFRMEVIHINPDEQENVIYDENIYFTTFQQSYEFTFKVDSAMVGQNFIDIRINGDRRITEYPNPKAYDNNELSIITGNKGHEFYVTDNQIKLSFPEEFAIVPKKEINLMVYGNTTIDTNAYVIFELDTTELFNSSLLQRERVRYYGGQLSWTPEIEATDSTVYYWRAATDNNIKLQWANSSFIYIPEKTGWNQSHYFQFKKNDENNVSFKESRKLEFDNEIYTVSIYNSLSSNIKGLRYNYNGQNVNQPYFWFNNFTGAYVILHNPKNFIIEKSPAGGHYGSYNPYNRYHRTTAFSLDSLQGRLNFMNFIENHPEDDVHIAVIFNVYKSSDSLNVEEWASDSIVNNGVNIFNFLERYGARKVRKLQTNIDAPYGFFFTKNGKVYDEKIGENEKDIIQIQADLPYSKIAGKITTPSFTLPHSPFLEYYYNHYEPSDTNYISILSQDSTLLFGDSLLNYNYTALDLDQDEPVHFGLYIKDSLDQTSPQLDYVRVYGDLTPDYAIGATKELALTNSVNKNIATTLPFYIFNISNENLDFITVKIDITDANNQVVEDTLLEMNMSIAPYDKLLIDYPFTSTINSEYLNVRIELNPEQQLTESRYDNNLIVKRLGVDVDDYNPQLDVYFDDTHIENGDIVASDVEIKIVLKDITEIPLLNREDLISFAIYDDLGNYLQEYDYESDKVTFHPSEKMGQDAITIIHGNFEPGIYTLSVQARDNEGNQSGSFKYYIQFEVTAQNSISTIINSPNPFTDETYFRYILTGRTAPDHYMLKIVDARGSLVHILTEKDLGKLKVGSHQFSQSWDGRVNGNPLPSGVYFYHLEIVDSAVDFSHLNTKYDNYHSGSWGKLLILR